MIKNISDSAFKITNIEFFERHLVGLNLSFGKASEEVAGVTRENNCNYGPGCLDCSIARKLLINKAKAG